MNRRRLVVLSPQAMVGDFISVVQYGGDNNHDYRTKVTPKTVCEMMEDESKGIITRLAAVNKFFMDIYKEHCVSIDEKAYLDYMKKPEDSAETMWFWQTCTEFGYYQSTSPRKAWKVYGFFGGANVSIPWLVKQCEQVFGDAYHNATVYAAIDKTIAFYGGVAGFNASRPSIVIDGTAHCGEMYVEADDDLPSFKKARRLIERHMTAWMYH
ncbi:hypothetical protein L596_017069 [Steinernema carpocapsae]|uniref:Uncharacterized protein n=1 Tax=Steinernema carpocapsae TaxID=34508 RepID=A0A4U5N1B6_STECR|nr:hypothetical protein L596_017069 [Steinernema carpocapsae]